MKQLVKYPPVIACIVFTVLMGLIFIMVVNEERRLEAEQRYSAFMRLSSVKADLEGLLGANLSVLRGLKAQIAVDPELVTRRFDAIAAELLAEDLQLRHIALAPDLVVRNVYPLEGNEKILGVDLRSLPDQIGAIQRSINLREVMLAGPVSLVQGGQGLIARLPVHQTLQGDHLWGIIAAVIDYDELLDQAGILGVDWGGSLAIRGRDGSGRGGEVFFGSEQAFRDEAIVVDVKLPFGNWVLGYYPAGGWQVTPERSLQMWIIGVLFAALNAIAAYFMAHTYRAKTLATETAIHRANYDGLTGLMNRHYFTRQLENQIADARRDGQRFALMFADLDMFKQVNDTYGHDVGDRLLQLFSHRMTDTLRRNDLVARLAGDEFVMLVKQVDSATQVEMLAEKLLERFNDVFSIDGRMLSISSSIGIAIFPTDGDSASQLLQNADHAMYAAKSAGRNRVFFFNRNMRLEVERHVQMHNEIIRGIDDGQFEVFYQPVLALNGSEINKCEALVRWNHPERGLVSPVEFIPVAEQTGAIRALGNFVLEQACIDMAHFNNAGLELKVAVNRSVKEFSALDVDQRWLQIMEQRQVKGEDIIFEITESLLMEQNVKQLAVIQSLRKAGVQFAIDDFGTGYSALNYLRSYPVEILKIDRSFIMDLLSDEQDRTLVDVIIRMGKTLGISVVAEGVESLDQINLLKELGCDYIQGFFLTRPVPRDEFIRFCQEWKLVTSL